MGAIDKAQDATEYAIDAVQEAYAYSDAHFNPETAANTQQAEAVEEAVVEADAIVEAAAEEAGDPAVQAEAEELE